MKRLQIPSSRKEFLVQAYNVLVRVSWAIFFFTLPFTSFPYFPSGLGGRTLVRPLSTYPLLLLLALVTLPRLIRQPLPRTFLPLLSFLFAATISSVLSISADIDALLGVTLPSRLVRSLATLVLGASFYFTVAMLHQTWDDLRFSIRWLYAGFTLALAWGSLQALYVVHYSPAYFKLLNYLQSFVSSRKLFTTRISGLTYEPKWFAEQICLLLIPWLLGAILSRGSLFRRFTLPRLSLWNLSLPASITIEWLLLLWASVVLLFTFSRTGLLILATLIVLSFLIYRASPTRQAIPVQVDPHLQEPKQRRLRLLKPRILLEIGAVICGLIVIFVLVGSQNPYFSRFWRYFTEARQRNRTYLEYIAFDQRFTYWQTAFIMFESQPLFGVGLGNYAFYFADMLPNRLYRTAEIIRLITPEDGRDRLITPKNLPARLLAETGLLGTATYFTFLLAILGCVQYGWFKHSTWRSRKSGQPDTPTSKHRLHAQLASLHPPMIATGGLLALVSSIFVLFSMDSFARPETWIAFGIITAAAHLSSENPENTVRSVQTEGFDEDMSNG